jgi:D-tyrosyl-tRNA(Tyr) deacylase
LLSVIDYKGSRLKLFGRFMRAVIQRVCSSSVEVQGRVVGQIGRGLLVYLSVGRGDEEKDAEFMADKISGLRIFSDEAGKMNLSVQDVGGAVLLVSNFTLHGDCRKGRRPGFDAAGLPEAAKALYEKTTELIADKGIQVAMGIFGANMQVNSVNDGPVTFLLDSTRLL